MEMAQRLVPLERWVELKLELKWNWSGIGVELKWNWSGIEVEMKWKMKWKWSGKWSGNEGENEVENGWEEQCDPSLQLFNYLSYRGNHEAKGSWVKAEWKCRKISWCLSAGMTQDQIASESFWWEEWRWDRLSKPNMGAEETPVWTIHGGVCDGGERSTKSRNTGSVQTRALESDKFSFQTHDNTRGWRDELPSESQFSEDEAHKEPDTLAPQDIFEPCRDELPSESSFPKFICQTWIKKWARRKRTVSLEFNSVFVPTFEIWC